VVSDAYILAAVARRNQDRRRRESLLKFLKCSLAFGGLVKSCPLMGEVVQRLCLSSEVIDKGAIVAESSHFSDASGSGPHSDSSHFFRVTLNALSAHDMPQERNLPLK